MLGDADKRRTYDQFGEEGVKEQEQRGGGPNMDDMFSQFFGGGGGGFRHGGHHQQREPVHEPLFENSDVQTLNLGSVFQFYRRKEIWVVLFYDVSKQDSKKLKDEYRLLAEKMFGIIKVGAIDCKEEEELCEEFSVFDYPQIKIFTENANDDGEVFKGKKEWKSISNAAAVKMQSFVRVVNNDNYDKFIEEQPEKRKVLLFTDRKSTAPLFKSLSKTYKDKLVFGEVKKDPELQKKFGVTATPALMVVTDGLIHQGETYNMTDIKIDQLKKFLSIHAYNKKTTQVKKAELVKLTSTNNKSPTSGVCGAKTSNLCVILFINAGGQGILDFYMPFVEEFKNDPITFTYVYSNKEPKLNMQFGLGGNAGAVIYKPKRSKYTKVVQPVSTKKPYIELESLRSMVEGALNGGGAQWEKLEGAL